MTTTARTITETDIIEARQRVAAAEQAGEQQDWNDALLASPDLEPSMVQEYFNSADVTLKVHWCACKEQHGRRASIVCETCNLPPFWRSIVVNVTQDSTKP